MQGRKPKQEVQHPKAMLPRTQSKMFSMIIKQVIPRINFPKSKIAPKLQHTNSIADIQKIRGLL